MPELHDLNDMYLFAKVIQHGGYSAASRALGIATSKLSRRISELERQLGVHLINRSTRKISLSEAGEAFYRHCVAIVSEADAAREAIEMTRATPQGLVRLSCPVGLLLSDVGSILAEFLAENPAVRVNLDATNRRVDVVAERFDLAIRVRLPPLEDSDLAVRRLGTSEMILACSRRFIVEHGKPLSIDDLAKLPTLSMDRPGQQFSWHFTDAHGGPVEFAHTPRLATDDLATLRTAALDGIGIAMLPEALIRGDLAAGTLVRILPELKVPPGIVHVVFPSRKGLVPAVRSLIDALVAGFGGTAD